MATQIVVHVQDARSAHSGDLPSEKEFQRWAALPLKGSEAEHELTLRIVDEDEVRQLNRDYRGKDKTTNVLSFSYDDHPQGYMGDVIICAGVVEREAAEQGIETNDHWAHLVIHGILHLMGFDHETKAQADEMESREIMLLEQLGIINPYEIQKEV